MKRVTPTSSFSCKSNSEMACFSHIQHAVHFCVHYSALVLLITNDVRNNKLCLYLDT